MGMVAPSYNASTDKVEEDQKFMTSLNYISSSKPPYATWNSISKKWEKKTFTGMYLYLHLTPTV